MSFGSGQIQPWNDGKRANQQEMQEFGKLTVENGNKSDEFD